MKEGTPDFTAAARAAAAVLLWLMILAPGAVLAQTLEPASRIGIVDVQRILGESVAMSALSKELEAIRIQPPGSPKGRGEGHSRGGQKPRPGAPEP